ncbi:MAG TPA: tRNA (guanine(37)-N(1))-methyltransferase, partial [Thermovirga lienii]|nr:tRNA (guanine(37)-N(1))-methyltransferase [Thermovirga lienii]
MRFSVVTAFPDFIESYFTTSIIGKAVQKGLLEYDVVNPRSFAEPPHNQIDDYAYGGGGMVLKAEPLARAVD